MSAKKPNPNDKFTDRQLAEGAAHGVKILAKDVRNLEKRVASIETTLTDHGERLGRLEGQMGEVLGLLHEVLVEVKRKPPGF